MRLARAAVFMGLILAAAAGRAEIRLTTDWLENVHGVYIPLADMETTKLEIATWKSLRSRIATPLDPDGKTLDMFSGQGYRMFFDGDLNYATVLGFMPKTRPDEACNIKDYVRQPNYRCEQGQRYTLACHLGLYNAKFEEAGWHTVTIRESQPVFCNAVPAMGRYDSKYNDLLLIVQYFGVDEPKVATTRSEIGSGWQRMAVRLKLSRVKDGRFSVEQDDSCLGNPNAISTIDDARRKLRQCEKQPGHR
ncbi:hypothetical protein CKO44_10595 [Rubrivivax gelatinosus]|uniref:Methanolan biosynthesis EpsI domain-containing protein n=1 Tax=Rubrivivax gelatinosus TaxID=28068 RepID=A0ABS1E0H6_RUBGE|nr:hypothetical protein [Rubrivivax gelatinosus]MBK1613916.1 hypothetical protein [Rubrivivax gelatinosus]MBK1715571.1 hypothetical protein [Rubrivivax gelatinosus]MBZ8143022.1 hypothetical protein [Rubrivivax gelatinosus]